MAKNLADFKTDEEASVAIEFAFLGVLFIVLIVSILQVFLLDATSKNLDESLQRSTRLIYTGQFQSANKSATTSSDRATALKQEMCKADKSPIFNCSDLKIDVRSSKSFQTGSLPMAIDGSTKKWKTDFGSTYDCIGAGTIVVITAAVRQPVPLPLLSFGSPEFFDGSRLLQKTVVFRTEFYDTSAAPSC